MGKGLQRCHPPTGFTLIETLISLMVFSVGMLGLAGLTTVIVRSNTLSQQITTATVLAQDTLEALQTLGYTSVIPTTGITISNRHRYTRSVGVVEEHPATGIKTVAITVTWGPEDAQHQVDLKTILTAER